MLSDVVQKSKAINFLSLQKLGFLLLIIDELEMSARCGIFLLLLPINSIVWGTEVFTTMPKATKWLVTQVTHVLS